VRASVAAAFFGLMTAAAASPGAAQAAEPSASLPARVRRIVLHTLGNPAYDRPELRFAFFPPAQTQALWKRGFGAHWIVWTDGSLWPRRRSSGAPSWRPASFGRATLAERRRLAWEAGPVYSHLHNGNSRTLGIEVAHSGRRTDAFPEQQLAAVTWLVRTLMEMSGGRVGPRSVLGHKDLDRRPAYVRFRCARAGCPVFVDDEGRAYRRRVDPPELLFAGLARYGVAVPRAAGADDELMRAERVPAGRRPQVAAAGAPRSGRAGSAP
jgi:hypothetical protein